MNFRPFFSWFIYFFAFNKRNLHKIQNFLSPLRHAASQALQSFSFTLIYSANADEWLQTTREERKKNVLCCPPKCENYYCKKFVFYILRPACGVSQQVEKILNFSKLEACCKLWGEKTFLVHQFSAWGFKIFYKRLSCIRCKEKWFCKS